MNISDHLRLITQELKQKADVELLFEVANIKAEQNKSHKVCHFCGLDNFMNAARCKNCKRTF